MRSKLFIAALALGSILLFAAPSWQKKDFSQWTEKDAKTILTDSPWAKQASIMGSGGSAAPSAPMGSGPSPSSGPPPTSSTNAGGSGGSTSTPSGGSSGGTSAPSSPPMAGGGGGGDTGPAASTRTVNVIWASALPVRLAQLKLKAGESAPNPQEVEQVSKPVASYAIAVAGLPVEGNGQNLASLATLEVKGKDPIRASKVDVQQSGDSSVVMFNFPKTVQLSPEDKNVEFKLKAKGMDLKKKFSLKDMQYQGKLEL